MNLDITYKGVYVVDQLINVIVFYFICTTGIIIDLVFVMAKMIGHWIISTYKWKYLQRGTPIKILDDTPTKKIIKMVNLINIIPGFPCWKCFSDKGGDEASL